MVSFLSFGLDPNSANSRPTLTTTHQREMTIQRRRCQRE
jgi:hypothetical protein